jgi:ribonuclease BN (tRNA processing enzyme)
MTLQFLGAGGAFAPLSVGNSNLLLTSGNDRKLLIDFGTTGPYILRDEMKIPFADIDGVYVSHCHSDHIGGLEQFAFSRYFIPPRIRPKLFGVPEIFDELWKRSLAGGLDSVQGKMMTLTDYFDCQPMADGFFDWEGWRFTAVPTVHIVSGYTIKHSYGLFMKDIYGRGRPTLFTTDTMFAPDLLAPWYYKASLILHDCETLPEEHRSGVHAHIKDLATLPVNTRKHDPSVRQFWLYHHGDPTHPLGDQFTGFVQKGQIFDLNAAS